MEGVLYNEQSKKKNSRELSNPSPLDTFESSSPPCGNFIATSRKLQALLLNMRLFRSLQISQQTTMIREDRSFLVHGGANHPPSPSAKAITGRLGYGANHAWQACQQPNTFLAQIANRKISSSEGL